MPQRSGAPAAPQPPAAQVRRVPQVRLVPPSLLRHRRGRLPRACRHRPEPVQRQPWRSRPGPRTPPSACERLVPRWSTRRNEQIRPFPGAWPSRPCSLRRTPSRVRKPGPSPLRSLYSARKSGPVSRSGAACAPSGVSTCCSSPRAHRALITIQPVLPAFLAAACNPHPPSRNQTSPVRIAARCGSRPGQVSARYLTSPPSASGPVARNALGIARRRLARSKQSWLGCR